MCRFRAGLPYLEARVTVTRTEDGGRRYPVCSGYRVDWEIGHFLEDATPHLFAGPIELIEAEELRPGETGAIRIYPLSPEYWKHLGTRSEIRMVEGDRLVGVASITSLNL